MSVKKAAVQANRQENILLASCTCPYEGCLSLEELHNLEIENTQSGTCHELIRVSQTSQ